VAQIAEANASKADLVERCVKVADDLPCLQRAAAEIVFAQALDDAGLWTVNGRRVPSPDVRSRRLAWLALVSVADSRQGGLALSKGTGPVPNAAVHATHTAVVMGGPEL
jgi:hypothetical protein